MDTLLAFVSRHASAVPPGTGVGWEYGAYPMGQRLCSVRSHSGLPVVLPLVEAAGFDEVWFGIFMVLVVKMALITPPVAFNFAVVQNITGRSTAYIARVTFPLLLIQDRFRDPDRRLPWVVTLLPDLPPG